MRRLAGKQLPLPVLGMWGFPGGSTRRRCMADGRSAQQSRLENPISLEFSFFAAVTFLKSFLPRAAALCFGHPESVAGHGEDVEEGARAARTQGNPRHSTESHKTGGENLLGEKVAV